jgi:peptide/nickel transport system substrate-binding protein
LVLGAVVATVVSMGAPAAGERVHALAMHGEPKHPAGFTQFPYVDADASKGGQIRLGTLGTFDSLNPFILKGVAPPGLREFVFESLMARSGDEPFTLYGLVAQSVEVPEDRSSITFHLNPEARFSDGAPVSSEDVLFSYEVLKTSGHPYHRAHYSKVAHAEASGRKSVTFTFGGGEDREMPLILGLMPVLPKHRLSAATFERTTFEPPIGSGPYTVQRVDPGRSITYARNPQWWGRDLAVNRGRYNFETIRVEHFRDTTSLFEALKSGEVRLREEDDPNRWIVGYQTAAVAEGRLLREELATELPAGMSALVFNTRRALFADARVRRAFLLLFNAEWINRSLYSGLYERTQSYFDRSELSSYNRPADARERALLQPFAGAVKPEILDGTYRLPGGASDNERSNLEQAFALLRESGYELDGTKLSKQGSPLAFEFLAETRQQERIMLAYASTLERLGITVQIRSVDAAQYWARLKRFDFDMIAWNWSASLSPGNEQINRWSSRSADAEGSLNYAGVKNPAADAMIEALLAARSAEDFTSAVRAFDRVLLSGEYAIPLFHLPKVWVAHWAELRHPQRLPLGGFELNTWWYAQP